ncbi:Hypothetical protein BN69_3628 [Methylocystis sp. SC2]|nr:Hypothetical protein BN69_3628 [Methylocystis sp. SC2]
MTRAGRRTQRLGDRALGSYSIRNIYRFNSEHIAATPLAQFIAMLRACANDPGVFRAISGMKG